MNKRSPGFGAIEIILVVVVLLIIGFVTFTFINQNNQAKNSQTAPNQSTNTPPKNNDQPDLNAKIVTHNFIDIANYQQISKFRSCEGHDFSGLGIHGESETNRSMKHYLEAKQDLVGSVGKLAIYAPFDGKITMLETDNRGHRIGVTSAKDDHWMMLFFHSDLAGDLKINSSVKAGQLLGYGNLSGGGGNFDVTLEWLPGGNSQEIRYDSPFLHMTDPVLAEFASHKLTPDNLIIDKPTRDAAPCQGFTRSDANWSAVF